MGQKYGKMVDVWAIGCTLYEMMHFDHAFQGADNGKILNNIIWAIHERIEPRWSDRLAFVVKSMLQLKPEDRPEACDLIKDAMFLPVLQSGGWAGRPPPTRHTVTSPVTSQRRHAAAG